MSERIQLVSITLNGLPVRAASFSTEENAPCQWSALVDPDDFDISTMDKTTEFTLAVEVLELDGDGTLLDSISWTSPPLVLADPKEGGGRQARYVQLQGTDKASYLLSSVGHAASTQHNKMAQTLMAGVGTMVGVTVSFPSTVNWRVEDFDVVGDTPVGQGIAQLCQASGLRYRIAKTGTGIEVVNFEYQVSSPVTVRYESWNRLRAWSKEYSEIVLVLQRKYKGTYVFPIDTTHEVILQGDLSPGLDVSTLDPTDFSTGGRIQYASFNNAAEELCAYYLLDPGGPSATPTGSGPAVKVFFKVLDPVAPMTRVTGELLVRGRPPSAYTYDPPGEVATTVAAWSSSTTYAAYDFASVGRAIYYSLAGSNLNHAPASSPTWWKPVTATVAGRKKILVVESTVWDTLAFMNERKPHILAAANSDTDVIDLPSVVFDPRYWAGEMISPAELPECRLHTTQWSYDGGRVSMSVTAHVV